MVSFAANRGGSASVGGKEEEGEKRTVIPRLPTARNGEVDPPALNARLDYSEPRARVAVTLLRDASDGIDDVVSEERETNQKSCRRWRRREEQAHVGPPFVEMSMTETEPAGGPSQFTATSAPCFQSTKHCDIEEERG